MGLTNFLTKGVRDAFQSWGSSGTGGANPSPTTSVSVHANNAQKRNLLPAECYAFNIAVNAAVGAIKSQFSKASPRLFNRGGEEVNGGPAFDILKMPSPGLSYARWIEEIVAWYNIAGEFGVRVSDYGQGGTPNSLLPLCPGLLEPEKPTNPRRPEDVVQWKYVWGDGTTEYIRGDYLAFDRMFNPDPYSVRGLSPLKVGAVQVSGQVAAEQYNKSFFDNGGIPSHLVVLPDGVPRQHREDFEKRYLSEYGRYGSNSHKVMVVAGKDVKVESLEQPFQEGSFMEMMKRGDLKVGQLYRVPAINMGIYDKTRFDTANEERKLFLEETLMPQAAAISACIQHQIIDRHFRYSPFSVKRPRSNGKLTKSMDRQFEKARSESGGTPLIFLIDPDTLPVANEVALAKSESALKFREAFMTTPRKAEHWVGLDIDDDSPERDQIWVTGTNIVCITKPELNAQLTPGVGGPAAAKPDDKLASPSSRENSSSRKKPKVKPKPTKAQEDEFRVRKTQLKTLIHKLRLLTLRDAAEGRGLWSLASADALNASSDPVLSSEIRKARHSLRGIVAKHSGQDRTDRIKSHFDSLDGAYVRGVLEG